MLPFEVWLRIINNIPNITIGEAIRYSQVNSEFRSLFLSDLVWTKFDAFGVRGQGHIHANSGYKLQGVAAHFFNYLSSLSPPEQATFFDSPRFDGEFASSTDLYSQINALSRITLKSEFDATCLQLIELSVWKLWSSTHQVTPREFSHNVDGGRLIPSWARRDKQTCLFLIQLNLVAFVEPIFENDWDINFALFTQRNSDRNVDIPLRFLQNREFALAALSFFENSQYLSRRRYRGVCRICEIWGADRDIVVRALALHGSALQFAPPEIQSDRKIVLEIVQRNGYSLRFASEDLRNDHEVVMAAINHGGSLDFASEDLRSDRDIVFAAVKRNGWALRSVSENLRSDREIVMEAVRGDASTFRLVAEKFCDDREVVMAAVASYGFALEYASRDLRGDREIVKAAVTAGNAGGQSLRYASEDLGNDRELVLAAVNQEGGALEFASKALRGDREIVMAAIMQWGGALEYATQDLRSDREFVLAAVTHTVDALGCASEDLRGDRDLVLAAIRLDGDALVYAHKSLQSDQELVMEAVKSTKNLFTLGSLVGRQKVFVWEVLRRKELQYLEHSREALVDTEFALEVVGQCGIALQYLPAELQNDKQIVLAAVRKHKGALRFASKGLQRDPEVFAAANPLSSKSFIRAGRGA